MRVFVYWNLHRKCWSVRAMDGAERGRVVAHATRLTIREATYQVSETIRRRVVETGHKEVHAGVVGTLDGLDGELTDAGRRTGLRYVYWMREDGRYLGMAKRHGRRVRYNPHRAPWFEADHGSDGREQWVRTNDAPMVAMTATGKRPTVLAFDPCAVPE